MEELKAAHLKLHILVYSGEKPFGCIQCNFSCTTAGNLRTHMLTHSGKKPFSCTQCKPPVYQPGTLRKRWLPIQETNLLVARSAKIPSQKLGTSNNTCSYTREKSISNVHSALWTKPLRKLELRILPKIITLAPIFSSQNYFR